MFDSQLRRVIDPAIARIARFLADKGVSPNAVTAAGLAIGLAAAGAIAFEHFAAGFVLIGLSRLCDGLDGAIARLKGSTDFGGFLDIVFDFVFYGAIPLGFALADPAANALAASVLLLSFYANGASVLAFAIMAEKRGIAAAEGRGGKSLMFTTGLAEAGETLACFLAACLFPACFPVIALVFAAVTTLTFTARVMMAARVLGDRDPGGSDDPSG